MMSPVANPTYRIIECIAVAAFLAVSLAGCASWGGSDTQSQQTTEPRDPVLPPEPAYAFGYPQEPPVLDARGLQVFVSKFRPRVVLLDFWASWSRQSRDEMPDLVKLQEELGTDEFQVISCNLDAVQQWSTETVPSLRARRANFPCVVIRPDAKSGMRAWLDSSWSYDLPARFILDSRGRVVGQALSNVPVADVLDQARSLVMGGGQKRDAIDAVALRMKLIDVRRGQSQSLPEVSAAKPDAQRLAAQVCQQLAPEIDRRLNVRIAILPFPSSRDRARAGTFGYETAEQVRQELRRQGYYDLVGPEQTEKMIAASGLTALSIDYEPAVVKDKLNCDFLLVGWLRGEMRPDPDKAEAPTVDDSSGSESGSTVAEHPEPQE